MPSLCLVQYGDHDHGHGHDLFLDLHHDENQQQRHILLNVCVFEGDGSILLARQLPLPFFAIQFQLNARNFNRTLTLSVVLAAVGQFFFLSAIQVVIASGVLREIPVPGMVVLGL
jgi:hypothetical protein